MSDEISQTHEFLILVEKTGQLLEHVRGEPYQTAMTRAGHYAQKERQRVVVKGISIVGTAAPR